MEHLNLSEEAVEMPREAKVIFKEFETEPNAIAFLGDELISRIREFNEGGEETYKILLPAGGTADKLFEYFKSHAQDIDFSRIHFIQGEQFWPLPDSHPLSLWGSVKKSLSDSGVPEENIHSFKNQAEDEELATRGVREALAGGVNFAIVGLNPSGAVAALRDGQEFKTQHLDIVQFDLDPTSLHKRENIPGMENLPHHSLESIVEGWWQKYWPNDPKNRPEKFFASGWLTMLEAKELYILATGENKRDALNAVIPTLGVVTELNREDGSCKKRGPVRNISDVSVPLTSTAEVASSRALNNRETIFVTDKKSGIEDIF